MFLASSKIDDEVPGHFNFDLLMPVKSYWEIMDLLQKASYLLANQEHMADIQEIYRQIFRIASCYALTEYDRNWLLRRSQRYTPSS